MHSGAEYQFEAKIFLSAIQVYGTTLVTLQSCEMLLKKETWWWYYAWNSIIGTKLDLHCDHMVDVATVVNKKTVQGAL